MKGSLLAVAALALLVRVGYEAAVSADGGPVGASAAHLLGDERAYDRLARDSAAGTLRRERAFYQEPLYGWLLGRLYALWPPAPVPERISAVPLDAPHRAVLWFQHALGLLACVLTATLGARALGPRVGTAAGLLAAASGPLVFHEAMLVKESLALAVLLGALHLWLDLLEERGGAARALALGLLTGIGILLRGNLYLLLAAIGLSLLAPIGTPRRRPGAALIVFSGALAAIAPVTLHNLRRGDLVLTTYQAGPNVAIGQPEGTGLDDGVVYEPLRAGRGDARFEEEDAVSLAEAASGRRLTGREVSAWWWRVTWERVAANPGVALARMGLKAAHLFAGAEVPDVKAWGFFAQAVPWLDTPLSNMTVVGPWALLGLLLLPWRRRPGLLVVRGGVLVVGLTLVLFYVMGRYRLPAGPCLWILGAGAAARGWQIVAAPGPWPRRAGVVLLGAAAPLAFWLVPPAPQIDPSPASWANASTIARQAAETARDPERSRHERDRAVSWAEQALALAPLFELARAARLRALTLATPFLEARHAEAEDEAWRLLLLLEGYRTGEDVLASLAEPQPAVRQRALALANRPSRPGGEVFTAPLLAEACLALAPYQRAAETLPLALAFVERSLALDPSNTAALVERGLVLKRLQRLPEAEAAYRVALAAGVRSVELYNNLGNLLLVLGRPHEAVEMLEEALALDPSTELAHSNLARARAAAAEPREP